ncbi:MAG: hypothetical protein ACO3EZ_11550 [Prochlorotrichaceae cyanobacterium]
MLNHKPFSNLFTQLTLSIVCSGLSIGGVTPGLMAEEVHTDHTDHPHEMQDTPMMDHHSNPAEMEHWNHEHGHSMIEIPEGAMVPEVELQVYPDTIKGWNLEVKVTHFRFAPESVNQPSDWNEGHAHLYVNGIKITRLYDRWYYLSELPVGDNEVTVTLNTNDHKDLWHNGKAIGATVQVTVNP